MNNPRLSSRLSLRLTLLALLIGSTAIVGLAGSPAFAASAYHVTTALNHTAIDKGESVTIHGRVTGGPVAGRSVVLYWTRASEDDSWHEIGTAALSKNGYYSRGYAPKMGGDIAFRAVKTAVPGHAQGAAVSDSMKVYEWASIWQYWNNGLDETDGPDGATAHKGKAIVNGITYPNSLLINDQAVAGFASYECKAIRGTVRVPDNSSVSYGEIDITNNNYTVGYDAAGGPVKINPPLSLNPNHSVALTGAIDGNGGTAEVVALTDPQLLCDAPA